MKMIAPRFPLGKIHATPRARAALKAAHLRPRKFLRRHAHGLTPEDY
jgi:hypothetical protein